MGSPRDPRLIGQPLPRLGHFDEKGLLSRIERSTRFLKAARCVSLIQFCDMHCRTAVFGWRSRVNVPDRLGHSSGKIRTASIMTIRRQNGAVKKTADFGRAAVADCRDRCTARTHACHRSRRRPRLRPRYIWPIYGPCLNELDDIGSEARDISGLGDRSEWPRSEGRSFTPQAGTRRADEVID
jgi:hypothetical protein